MSDHTALVAQVKADLIALGIIPVPQTTNCHAFAICAETAWRLRQMGENVRLVAVTSGNGCDWSDGRHYRLDAIAYPGGQWKDCLGSAGPTDNFNTPRWGDTGTDPNAELVEPFSVIPEPVPGEDPPPTEWMTGVLRSLGALADLHDEQARHIRNIVNTVAAQASTLPK